MSKEQEPFEYDETQAVKFVQNTLPQELKGKFSDDEIIYVIDIVYDFYDSKGLMDEEDLDEEVVEIDEEELIDYVLKCTKKEKVKDFTAEEITLIVKGELEYCDSLNLFE